MIWQIVVSLYVVNYSTYNLVDRLSVEMPMFLFTTQGTIGSDPGRAV